MMHEKRPFSDHPIYIFYGNGINKINHQKFGENIFYQDIKKQ
jgi:hypothetical protein